MESYVCLRNCTRIHSQMLRAVHGARHSTGLQARAVQQVWPQNCLAAVEATAQSLWRAHRTLWNLKLKHCQQRARCAVASTRLSVEPGLPPRQEHACGAYVAEEIGAIPTARIQNAGHGGLLDVAVDTEGADIWVYLSYAERGLHGPVDGLMCNVDTAVPGISEQPAQRSGAQTGCDTRRAVHTPLEPAALQEGVR